MSSSDSSSEDEKQKKKLDKKQKKEEKKKDASAKSKKRAKDDSSSDEGVEDKTPVKKQKKGESSVLGNRMTNSDGDEMIEIGSMKYVTVRSFKGKAYVDIREYYTDKGSGKILPGKKGISMNKEQFMNFKSNLDEISEKLTQMQ